MNSPESDGWAAAKISRGMQYQIFKPIPLTGLTPQACTRLDLLRKDLSFVKGLTVLDIGAHAGMASLAALEAGAVSVLSTDISDTFTSDLNSYYNRENLCGRAELISFDRLSQSHSRDCVFALEVIHWLVHQNTPLVGIADKLDLLANSYIYIETPIDATDPSIATSLGSKAVARYRLNVILDRLLDRGWRVSYLGSALYFGEEYNRVRLLASK